MQDRDRLHEELLWAASDLFAACGYEQASLQLIADSAGVSLAILDAQFGDKEQLFNAVLDYWLDALPAPRLPLQPKGGLHACLQRVATELLLQGRHPATQALTYILSRASRIPHKRWRQRHRPHQLWLEKVLARSPRCSEPTQAARQFLLLTVGSLDCHNPMAVSEARVSAAVELFVQAYG